MLRNYVKYVFNFVVNGIFFIELQIVDLDL